MTQLETLIAEIPKYQPGADLDVLARAYQFSAASHTPDRVVPVPR